MSLVNPRLCSAKHKRGCVAAQLCGGSGVNGVGSPSPGRGMQHNFRSEGCGRYFVQVDRSFRTTGSRGSLEGFTSIPESNDGGVGTMSSVHMVRVRLLRS